MQSLRTPGNVGQRMLGWGAFSHQQQEAGPILAVLRALPTCLRPTNLCLCLVLNFPARCLVINGVSFGSTPAGDRGIPYLLLLSLLLLAPPSLGAEEGDRMGQGQGACACRLPSVLGPQ